MKVQVTASILSFYFYIYVLIWKITVPTVTIKHLAYITMQRLCFLSLHLSTAQLWLLDALVLAARANGHHEANLF